MNAVLTCACIVAVRRGVKVGEQVYCSRCQRWENVVKSGVETPTRKKPRGVRR